MTSTSTTSTSSSKTSTSPSMQEMVWQSASPVWLPNTFPLLGPNRIHSENWKIILNICLLPQKQQWMCIYSCNHIRQRGATWPTGFYLIFIRFPQSSHINHVLAFTNMFLFYIHFAKTHVLTSMAWLEKAKKQESIYFHFEFHEPYLLCPDGYSVWNGYISMGWVCAVCLGAFFQGNLKFISLRVHTNVFQAYEKSSRVQ